MIRKIRTSDTGFRQGIYKQEARNNPVVAGVSVILLEDKDREFGSRYRSVYISVPQLQCLEVKKDNGLCFPVHFVSPIMKDKRFPLIYWLRSDSRFLINKATEIMPTVNLPPLRPVTSSSEGMERQAERRREKKGFHGCLLSNPVIGITSVSLPFHRHNASNC